MMSQSAAIEYAKGMLESGEVKDVCEANVAIVRMMGFQIVTRLPRDVRSALNAAVKDGRLGHLPKKGLLPEAYFHPNGKWNAMEERQRIASAAVSAISKVCG